MHIRYILTFAFTGFVLLGCDPQKAIDQQATNQMQKITNQVAADSVSQYEIAKRSGGTPIDICVQAGFVTASFLQAKDEANYKKWKEIEKSDCERAGVPK